MSESSTPTKKCSQKNLCLCSLTLSSNNTPLFDYPTDTNENIIYLHDKDSLGIPFTIDLKSKCERDPAGCPAGVLYEKKEFAVYNEFTPSVTKTKLKYINKDNDILGFRDKLLGFDVVKFFYAVITGDFKKVPSTDYHLIVGECDGKELVPYYISIPKSTRTVALGESACQKHIRVFPAYKSKLEFSLEVCTKKQTSKIEDSEMSLISVAQQIKAAGTLDINGQTFTPEQITEKFTKRIENFETLKQAERALENVGNVFTNSTGKKSNILDFSLTPPKITINGTCDLELTKKYIPYFKRSYTLGFSPLVGFTFSVNLLQALLAYFTGTTFAAYLNEKIAEAKAKYGDKATADLALKFTFSSTFDFSYTVTPTDNKPTEYSLSIDASKIKITITAQSMVTVGIKVSVFEGLFKAEAIATAVGYLELCKNKKKDIEGIFYHDGVKAKVLVETSFNSEPTDSPSSSSTFSQNQHKQKKAAAKTPTTTWLIYKKLPKELSTHRITFFNA